MWPLKRALILREPADMDAAITAVETVALEIDARFAMPMQELETFNSGPVEGLMSTDIYGGRKYAIALINDETLGVCYFEFICPLLEQIPQIVTILAARHPVLDGSELLKAAHSLDPASIARLGLGWIDTELAEVRDLIRAAMLDREPVVRSAAFFAAGRLGWKVFVETAREAQKRYPSSETYRMADDLVETLGG